MAEVQGLTLAWMEGDTALQCALAVPAEPATVEAALNAARAAGIGPLAMIEDALAGRAGLALHGLRARSADPVEAGDRIELLAPLQADPKQARHRRVDAARAAGGRDKWRPNWREGPTPRSE